MGRATPMWEGNGTNMNNNANVRSTHNMWRATKRFFLKTQPTQKDQCEKNSTKRKKQLCKEMKLRLHFIVFPLSLTLNNAFALLGGGYYLGTLKWKTLRIR